MTDQFTLGSTKFPFFFFLVGVVWGKFYAFLMYVLCELSINLTFILAEIVKKKL